MSKHTPGPWKVQHDPFNPNVRIVGDKELIVCVQATDMFAKETEANAALIAAAPDMLEALENRTEILCGMSCNKDAGFHTGACEMARAAISKAKGK